MLTNRLWPQLSRDRLGYNSLTPPNLPKGEEKSPFGGFRGSDCRLILLFFFTFFINSQLHSQAKILDKTIHFSKKELCVSDILLALAKQDINFTYKDNKEATNQIYSLQKSRYTLKEVLDLLADDDKLCYKVSGNNIIIKPQKKQYNIISGFVYDASSGEQLVAASVYDPKTYTGTITNGYGFYRCAIKKRHNKIRYSILGFEPVELTISNKKDTVINISLKPNIPIEEVVVNDENNSFIQSTTLSNHQLNATIIKRQALVLGEQDLLKSVQLLSGIQPSIEGSTGLQVRGGSHAHNLITIDDVPVYNIDHAFGFFSIFNSDAIKSVQLYKGAFPARYGGKVSSVLDLRMNEGNNKYLQIDFSTGLILSKLKVEAPIVKDKTSFMLSTRRTHFDLPLKALKDPSDNETENYSFADVYAKLNHKFSGKDRVYLSFFYGNDIYKQDITRQNATTVNDYNSYLKWHNSATALRWNHIFSEKFFCNTAITYSKYHFKHKKTELHQNTVNNQLEQFTKDTNYYSGIEDLGAKINFDMPFSQKHHVRVGVAASQQTYQPFMEGSLLMVSKTSNNPMYVPEFDIIYDTVMHNANIESYTTAAYIEDEFELFKGLRFNLGFRFNAYYGNDTAYYSPEPRIAISQSIGSVFAIKAGYSRMSQNTHLLSNSFLILPFNVWVPSSKYLKPLFSEQYSAALNLKLFKSVNISAEGFYKTIENDMMYLNGSNILSMENDIMQGIRRSYGAEFNINKQVGKLTGWCTYTLSKTERKFDDINDGEYFPYWLVRKHKISATVNLQVAKWLDFTARWMYSSGVSESNGYQDLAPVFYQKGANSTSISNQSWELVEDIPAYHKLDAGINLHKQIRRARHTICLGLNNAYARNNPLLIAEYEGYLYLSTINLFMPYLQYSLRFVGRER